MIHDMQSKIYPSYPIQTASLVYCRLETVVMKLV